MAKAQKKQADGVRVHVKVARTSSQKEAAQTLSEVTGVRAVEPIFPDEKDTDLAQLFVVETTPADAPSVVKRLRQHPAVEYVERPAPRKLIR